MLRLIIPLNVFPKHFIGALNAVRFTTVALDVNVQCFHSLKRSSALKKHLAF